MQCPFCEIDKEKTRIIKSGSHSLVIFSNPRLMPGHLLVVPRRHVEKLSDLKKEEKEEIFQLLEEFQEKILKNIAPGCDIRQNYRPFQKQGRLKVHHLHFHLQPRFFEDELYQKCQKFETELFLEAKREEIEKILKLI
jgi:histidine triad (HIT) family protein